MGNLLNMQFLYQLRSLILFLLIGGIMFAAASEPLKKLIVGRMMSAVDKELLSETNKGSHFFMTVFSYQDKGNHPEASHTFATFIEIDQFGKRKISTISWLPEDFKKNYKLCVFKGQLWPIEGMNECKAVRGKNYSLDETLGFAARGKRKVGMWGPYEIQKTLYQQAQNRIKVLESNSIMYAADDRYTRKQGVAVNCLHAVSDLGGTRSERGGFLGTGWGVWGFSGTIQILKHFNKNSDTWLAKNKKIERNIFHAFVYSGFEKTKTKLNSIFSESEVEEAPPHIHTLATKQKLGGNGI